MKVDESNIQDNKSLVLQVTDPELLSLTGGIVQGTAGDHRRHRPGHERQPHHPERKANWRGYPCFRSGFGERVWDFY